MMAVFQLNCDLVLRKSNDSNTLFIETSFRRRNNCPKIIATADCNSVVRGPLAMV